jgi:hypothetical protein
MRVAYATCVPDSSKRQSRDIPPASAANAHAVAAPLAGQTKSMASTWATQIATKGLHLHG